MSASDADFNGRWNLTVQNEPKGRAWWLEVQGAGTAEISGRFVGFTGGGMDPIPFITISNRELRFTDKSGKFSYSAELKDGKLVGARSDASGQLKFTGERAPAILEKDDGSWHEGTPVELFNHKDLSGWEPATGWSVENGILKSTGGAQNLETAAKFWNFKLHIEYRVGPKTNSGIGLRGRYEVQILNDYGKPRDIHGNGALYSRIVPELNASKAPDEWQSFDIRLVGRQVTVVLNDKKIIDRQEIEGLTAIATDAHEDQPGPIVLQGDHGPVDFRSVVLTPLVH